MKTSKLTREHDRLWSKLYFYFKLCCYENLGIPSQNYQDFINVHFEIAQNFSKLVSNKEVYLELSSRLKAYSVFLIECMKDGFKFEKQQKKILREICREISRVYHFSWDRINQKNIENMFRKVFENYLSFAKLISEKQFHQASFDEKEILEFNYEMSDYICSKF